MSRRSERGEGNFEAIATLAVFIVVCLICWNVGSVYFIDWALKDKMVVAARTSRSTAGNDETYKQLEKAITELGLGDYLAAEDCEVRIDGTNRIVKCAYDRDMTIVFGIKRKVHFESEITQPLL